MICESRHRCRSYVSETFADDTDNFKMARRKRNFHLIAGVIVGLLFGYLVKVSIRSGNGFSQCPKNYRRFSSSRPIDEFVPLDPLKIIGLTDDTENVHNSDRSLLFVGVMTADQYLDTRALAVYRTWGRDLPGRMAFFSSDRSKSSYLPLVALPGVDDRYPPQKKSFMMLLYMHDNFIDRFEWFLRADDDVFIKTDKLEKLLRSVDSRKPQFIGQAGRGNSEEFGSLSLEYDENFCMGGPGVILSRETLKRIAPHIKECLKNLYTTHEDVELGRCVQKFAGVPCTWSYEMQSILYHNSSGDMAFMGNLKRKDVHNAITMHPVKNHINMYRINAYLKNLKIQQLKEVTMALHRDVLAAAKELSASPTFISSYYIANSVPLYPHVRGHPNFLGDTSILGVAPSLNRYNPKELKNVLIWDHIAKLIFSIDNANPRRRMEVSILECLDDIIREFMEIINGYSKQRGRTIEFKEILYGYQRLDPIHGVDYVLDIFLVYKKYRGKKMTVPVRRHVYLQQSFTDINIREVPLGEPPKSNPTTDEPTQKIDYDMDHAYPLDDLGGSANSIPIINFKKFNVPIRGIMKLGESLPNIFKSHQDDDYLKKSSKKINFILPLSGRYDIFVRFMKNYENVCLISDKQTSIIITLYDDKRYPSDFEKTINLVNSYTRKYPYSEIKLVIVNDSQFSRGLSLEKGIEKCKDDDLLFFIDVDIVFNAESLQRIRLNTVKHHTAYFPIVYSEYDPSVVNNIEYNIVKSRHLNKNSVVPNDYIDEKPYSFNHIDHINSDDYGYFRQFGFGIASVYKNDFVSVGGFNREIKGWGLEDVHLFDKFVQSNISIFRAVDKGLVHVFHPVYCDKNLDVTQYQMCVGTRTNTFGSTKHMTIYIFNHQNLLPNAKTESDSDKSKVVPPSR